MRFTATLLLALAAALPQAAFAQAEPAPLPYRLKSPDTHTGSHAKRDTISSRLPYDKTYDQLSDKDKAVVRSVYPDMGPDDEPPFPARGFKKIYRTIMTIMEKRPVAGKLDIAIMVDENGNGTSVKVYESPDQEVTRIVAQMMMSEKYKPALCKGQPCLQEFPFEMDFRFE